MPHNAARWLCSILLLLVALSTAEPSSALSQGAARTFPETGKTVSGRFLEYWNTHGGLMQQGYPISEVIEEVSDTDGKRYSVQYFERAVFEAHPEFPPPNDVLLSLLGVFAYNSAYSSTVGAPGQHASDAPGAHRFTETGHTVGGSFLKYWNEHGGLVQQGYPISEEFVEVSALDGRPYKVQYFERAVFEAHPENAPPYDVLLSQLGTLRYARKYGQGALPGPPTSSVPTGVPTAIPQPTATATPPQPPSSPTQIPTPKATSTPAPTRCPAINALSLSFGSSTGFDVVVRWSLSGGGARIRGELTIEEDGGRTETVQVGSRQGQATFWPSCGFGAPPVVSAAITLRDECDQEADADGSATVAREPCP